MCPSVENPYLVYQQTGYSQSLTHPIPAECGSRQAIQARPDHSNRIQRFSKQYETGGTSIDRPFFDKFQQQPGSVCVTSARPLAWAVDAHSLPREDLDPYAFPPAAILGKVVEKLQDCPCSRIILIAQG